MNIKIYNSNNVCAAELKEYPEIIDDTGDMLDIMANAQYKGAGSIILKEEQLHPDFFDLKTGLAGEILQKFSNYRMRLAIIGDFSKYKSNSLKDFIFESNKTGRIIFVGSVDEAVTNLCGKK